MTRQLLARLCAVAVLGALAGACATSAYTRPAPFPRAASTEDAPPPTRTSAAIPTASTVPAAAARLIASALALRGTPYRWGGSSPDTGFDCSGFVSYVWRQHGVVLPRTTADQFAAGEPVNRSDVSPGDLVFFSTIGPGPTHVGIVVEAGSTPLFIHAPADGSSVRTERFDSSYWESRWAGARRVQLPPTGGTSTGGTTGTAGVGVAIGVVAGTGVSTGGVFRPMRPRMICCRRRRRALGRAGL